MPKHQYRYAKADGTPAKQYYSSVFEAAGIDPVKAAQDNPCRKGRDDGDEWPESCNVRVKAYPGDRGRSVPVPDDAGDTGFVYANQAKVPCGRGRETAVWVREVTTFEQIPVCVSQADAALLSETKKARADEARKATRERNKTGKSAATPVAVKAKPVPKPMKAKAGKPKATKAKATKAKATKAKTAKSKRVLVDTVTRVLPKPKTKIEAKTAKPAKPTETRQVNWSREERAAEMARAKANREAEMRSADRDVVRQFSASNPTKWGECLAKANKRSKESDEAFEARVARLCKSGALKGLSTRRRRRR